MSGLSPPGSSVHGIFQVEYWSGLPFPPPGDLPDSGINPRLLCRLHWQADSFPIVPPGKTRIFVKTRHFTNLRICILTNEKDSSLKGLGFSFQNLEKKKISTSMSWRYLFGFLP